MHEFENRLLQGDDEAYNFGIYRVNQNILYIRNEKKRRPPDYLQL